MLGRGGCELWGGWCSSLGSFGVVGVILGWFLGGVWVVFGRSSGLSCRGDFGVRYAGFGMPLGWVVGCFYT